MKMSNPERNKAILLKEQMYMRNYRKRMKKSNQHQLVLSISESIEGRFSLRSTHLRSMWTAERALPKSLGKRNAFVSSLAKKFQLQIMPETNNRERPKKNWRQMKNLGCLIFKTTPILLMQHLVREIKWT